MQFLRSVLLWGKFYPTWKLVDIPIDKWADLAQWLMQWKLSLTIFKFWRGLERIFSQGTFPWRFTNCSRMGTASQERSGKERELQICFWHLFWQAKKCVDSGNAKINLSLSLDSQFIMGKVLKNCYNNLVSYHSILRNCCTVYRRC